jgi:hypothetical protein
VGLDRFKGFRSVHAGRRRAVVRKYPSVYPSLQDFCGYNDDDDNLGLRIDTGSCLGPAAMSEGVWGGRPPGAGRLKIPVV